MAGQHSKWYRKIERGPVQQAALRQGEIVAQTMQAGAVVPHQQVAHLPAMPVDLIGLGAERLQLFDQSTAFLFRQAKQPRRCGGFSNGARSNGWRNPGRPTG